MEYYKNNASTTLDSGINDSQTTFDVIDADALPEEQYRIKVDDELMLVTGVATNTLTVTRGIEGTTAASHAGGALVQHLLTAGFFDAFQADNVVINLTTPSFVRPGRLHFNDESVRASDNAQWLTLGVLTRWNIPPTSGWSWLDQGSATVNSLPIGEQIVYPDNSANLRCRTRSLVDGSGFDLKMYLLRDVMCANNGRSATFIRNSSSNLQVAIEIIEGDIRVRRATWNGSSWSSESSYIEQDTINGLATNGFLTRFVYDGTDIEFYVSVDGHTWMLLHTVDAATALSGDPDLCGFGCGGTNSGISDYVVTLVHLEET